MSGESPSDSSEPHSDSEAEPDFAESANTESRTPPECPRCSRPVTAVTVCGPEDAQAAPYGCRLHPGELERS
ncbi:hypothetical protein OB955_13225 [Halobacteria archaeon AArc-m2/3/4]|uniref:Small CPxCG-related zinc finger protein n=1 Tax=Natronoglomus mannanivorans TaxID=2979990 RepID=A0AAP2YWT9_9EURY|nr:hypothetical protein [Halobacteria archaeon AArc-xg1-1]MCU4973696.1 hypothetical protein [Halobacteria archaeon AArc-m2/3/4]